MMYETKVAKVSREAAWLCGGKVIVRVQAMYLSGPASHIADAASIAIDFGTGSERGLRNGFHASTTEMRELARVLIEHCDAADEMQADALRAAGEAA